MSCPVVINDRTGAMASSLLGPLFPEQHVRLVGVFEWPAKFVILVTFEHVGDGRQDLVSLSAPYAKDLISIQIGIDGDKFVIGIADGWVEGSAAGRHYYEENSRGGQIILEQGHIYQAIVTFTTYDSDEYMAKYPRVRGTPSSKNEQSISVSINGREAIAQFPLRKHLDFTKLSPVIYAGCYLGHGMRNFVPQAKGQMCECSFWNEGHDLHEATVRIQWTGPKGGDDDKLRTITFVYIRKNGDEETLGGVTIKPSALLLSIICAGNVVIHKKIARVTIENMDWLLRPLQSLETFHRTHLPTPEDDDQSELHFHLVVRGMFVI